MDHPQWPTSSSSTDMIWIHFISIIQTVIRFELNFTPICIRWRWKATEGMNNRRGDLNIKIGVEILAFFVGLSYCHVLDEHSKWGKSNFWEYRLRWYKYGRIGHRLYHYASDRHLRFSNMFKLVRIVKMCILLKDIFKSINVNS